MESKLDPGFVYEDIEHSITENDIDVVSDLWEMDGREVYRGSLDPRYTHANVYWLYNENLERVGLAEHSKIDHAVVHLLWYQDSEFGTLLQEDGWTCDYDIWSRVPRSVFDRFINEGWTTSESFLEQCLHGPTRVVTPNMVRELPMVYTCAKCGRKSLKPILGCDMTSERLDLPVKEKLFFIDFDMVVHVPPRNSTIWSRLGFMPLKPLKPEHQPHDDGSSRVREQEPLESAQ
jgi:hypothetical protein